MSQKFAIRCEALRMVQPSGKETLTILDGIDLEILAGEFVAVTGPSGSGKSTLLSLLAGLDRPTSGEVWIDGQALSGLNEDGLAALRRDRIGFVFQSFHLLSNLTAFENIKMPLDLARRPGGAARAAAMLEAVGLKDRSHHHPAELSGGEQQRVAIARAFAAEPRILFADEPTGNLDSETGQRTLQLFDDLRRAQQTTIVLVTHDAKVAARASRRLGLEAGRIVADELTSASGAAS